MRDYKAYRGEFELVTVFHHDGRRITAQWPVGAVDKLADQGAIRGAIIHH